MENKIKFQTDLNKIIDSENITVFKFDFTEDIDDFYQRYGSECIRNSHFKSNSLTFSFIHNNTKYIALNSFVKHGVKLRKSIARELGHFALNHHDYTQETEKLFIQHELEATKFAYNLLIPQDKLELFIRNNGKVTVFELASQFQVSLMTMKLRLESLGLL